jgi:hypothetical protein
MSDGSLIPNKLEVEPDSQPMNQSGSSPWLNLGFSLGLLSYRQLFVQIFQKATAQCLELHVHSIFRVSN